MLKLAFTLCSLFILSTLVVACGAKQGFESEADCNFVQNVYGERISWKDEAPVEIYVHSSYPQKYVGALEAAIETFEKTAGRPLFKFMGYASGPLQPRQDGQSIIYWMSTWEVDKKSEQARTSIYWVGEQIKEADIRINDFNFNYYWLEESTTSNIHIESLLLHELGHVLGLKHNDQSPSVMSTYLSSSTVRNEISEFDANSLRCEY